MIVLILTAAVFIGLLVRDWRRQFPRRADRATRAGDRHRPLVVEEAGRPVNRAARNGIAPISRSPRAISEREARDLTAPRSGQVLNLGAEQVPQSIRDRYREAS